MFVALLTEVLLFVLIAVLTEVFVLLLVLLELELLKLRITPLYWVLFMLVF
jgi:hypothetical protein